MYSPLYLYFMAPAPQSTNIQDVTVRTLLFSADATSSFLTWTTLRSLLIAISKFKRIIALEIRLTWTSSKINKSNFEISIIFKFFGKSAEKFRLRFRYVKIFQTVCGCNLIISISFSDAFCCDREKIANRRVGQRNGATSRLYPFDLSALDITQFFLFLRRYF